MRSGLRQLSYLWALLVANLKGYAPDRKKLVLMSLFMMIQNMMFFAFWLILFRSVDDLHGWTLADVTHMFGLTASTVGLALFFCNGVRTIAIRIQDGSLDAFIARPRNPLPLVLTSSSSPASLGDVLYGPFLWALFAPLSWGKGLALFLLAVNGAVIFLAVLVMLYSVGFWLKNSTRFCEQMFETVIVSFCNMTHGQPLLLRFVLFSVIPAGFVNYLPIEFIRSFDPRLLAVILAASLFYAWLAFVIFKAGVRRYVNSL